MKKEIQAVLALTRQSSRINTNVNTNNDSIEGLNDSVVNEHCSSTNSEYAISDNVSSSIHEAQEEQYQCHEDEDICFNDNSSEDMANEFRYKLKEWAIKNQPTQNQLKGLLSVINSTLPFKVPADPRTLLFTPSHVDIICLASEEQYWHHGLKLSLKNVKDFHQTKFHKLSRSI